MSRNAEFMVTSILPVLRADAPGLCDRASVSAWHRINYIQTMYRLKEKRMIWGITVNKGKKGL